MADKNEKPKVEIDTIKLGKVWDAKACKNVPDWATAALEKGLGRDVDVGKAGKDGFVLLATIDLDFDEKNGELKGQISVLATDAGKRAKANLTSKGTLKKVDKGSLDKNLKKLVDAMGAKAGSDSADEVLNMAKEK